MQDLLGRSRHRAQHRTPEVLVLEPHDEIGAAEVGKHESLAQPERRLRKLLHLLLLSRHDGALLPKPAEGEGVRILFGHEDGDLRDRRLPFENRLRRGAAVVLMALGDDGVEPHVLILQRMHELVRDDNPQLARADVGRDVERVGIGIGHSARVPSATRNVRRLFPGAPASSRRSRAFHLARKRRGC